MKRGFDEPSRCSSTGSTNWSRRWLRKRWAEDRQLTQYRSSETREIYKLIYISRIAVFVFVRSFELNRWACIWEVHWHSITSGQMSFSQIRLEDSHLVTSAQALRDEPHPNPELQLHPNMNHAGSAPQKISASTSCAYISAEYCCQSQIRTLGRRFMNIYTIWSTISK